MTKRFAALLAALSLALLAGCGEENGGPVSPASSLGPPPEFEFEIPQGWVDPPQSAKDAFERRFGAMAGDIGSGTVSLEAAYEEARAGRGILNVASDPGIGDGSSEDLEMTATAGLADVSAPEEVDLGGSEALLITGREPADTETTKTVVTTFQDGWTVALIFSSIDGSSVEPVRSDIDAIVESWEWTD